MKVQDRQNGPFFGLTRKNWLATRLTTNKLHYILIPPKLSFRQGITQDLCDVTCNYSPDGPVPFLPFDNPQRCHQLGRVTANRTENAAHHDPQLLTQCFLQTIGLHIINPVWICILHQLEAHHEPQMLTQCLQQLHSIIDLPCMYITLRDLLTPCLRPTNNWFTLLTPFALHCMECTRESRIAIFTIYVDH